MDGTSAEPPDEKSLLHGSLAYKSTLENSQTPKSVLGPRAHTIVFGNKIKTHEFRTKARLPPGFDFDAENS